MSDLANAHVSVFNGSFDSHPQRTVTLGYVLEGIRTGRYAMQVRRVRQTLATQGKAAYDQAKRALPAVTFGGTFKPSRGNDHLTRHSGIIHADLDHLPDLAATKAALCDDPSVVYVFSSPSGTGLKVGRHILPVADDAAYKHAWHAVRADCERRYGVTWDPSGKDVARLCYLSYDPDIYVNFEAHVFDVRPAPAPEPTPPTRTRHAPLPSHPDRRRMYAERAIRTATDMIQSAPMGTRHHTRLKASRLLGGYVAGGVLTDEEAYGALAQALVGYTEDLKRALDTVEDGLRYGQAHPISLDDLEAERQAWIRAHRPAAQVQRSTPPTNSAWVGMNTLPIRPFSRRQLIRTPGRQVHNG
jgi:hypothetical protein